MSDKRKERDARIVRAVERAITTEVPDASPIEIALLFHRMTAGLWRLAGYKKPRSTEEELRQ